MYLYMSVCVCVVGGGCMRHEYVGESVWDRSSVYGSPRIHVGALGRRAILGLN